jgi:hypothetical protein
MPEQKIKPMNTKSLVIVAALLAVTFSCQEKKTDTEDSMGMENTESTITIEKLESSPAYSSSSLKLKMPVNASIKNPGAVDFSFEVGNYELGVQTEKNGMAGMLANSDKGQHIHLIVDNGPYSAHYEPTFKNEMTEGTHYVVAFLSRSYHESVKNADSFIAKEIVVGTIGDNMGVNLEKPTLIYSRPKGEYSGADTENLLLDFFLLNTTLSESGNKVRATINGKEFSISEWAPYVIKGLPKGEVSIQLELLDEYGNMIPGGFNDVTRKVMLKD